MATPSAQRFVVKPKSGRLPEGLEGKPAGSNGLFVVNISAQGEDARDGWDQLMREQGDSLAFVAPVIVDRQGRESLPTGKIVVQFQQAPSGDALQKFADAHGLRFLQKSEFRPNQVSFEPLAQQPTYLPDLMAKLKSDPNISLAAPETVAKYDRT